MKIYIFVVTIIFIIAIIVLLILHPYLFTYLNSKYWAEFATFWFQLILCFVNIINVVIFIKISRIAHEIQTSQAQSSTLTQQQLAINRLKFEIAQNIISDINNLVSSQLKDDALKIYYEQLHTHKAWCDTSVFSKEIGENITKQLNILNEIFKMSKKEKVHKENELLTYKDQLIALVAADLKLSAK